MIQVIYWPDVPKVRVLGHADSGPRGQDILCAAVTALVLTLRENGRGILSPGRAEIWGTKEKKAQFEGICRGFTYLARRYPRHIRYCRAGDREQMQTMIN